ncbi:hypothetical protein D3C87_1644060 [compost metagenome]
MTLYRRHGGSRHDDGGAYGRVCGDDRDHGHARNRIHHHDRGDDGRDDRQQSHRAASDPHPLSSKMDHKVRLPASTGC